MVALALVSLAAVAGAQAPRRVTFDFTGDGTSDLLFANYQSTVFWDFDANGVVADENFNGDIVRGLLRRNARIDIVRVQDVGLSDSDDPTRFSVRALAPIGPTIFDLVLLTECSLDGEYEGRVQFLPRSRSGSFGHESDVGLQIDELLRSSSS